MTNGQAELVLQIHQLEAGFLAQLAVERGHRLVEQEQPRPLGERARQRHPLALAAGQLVRPAAPEAVELDQRQHLVDTGVDLGPRQRLLLEAERDVAGNRQMREQRIALEHHVDRPPVRRQAGDVLAAEQDAAFTRLLEAREHAQQRGLAAARGPEQREEFTLVDVERDAIDGGHLAEAFADRFERHQRLGGLR